MTISADPGEMACYEPSHLNLEFVKVSLLVCRPERVKESDYILCDPIIKSVIISLNLRFYYYNYTLSLRFTTL